MELGKGYREHWVPARWMQSCCMCSILPLALWQHELYASAWLHTDHTSHLPLVHRIQKQKRLLYCGAAEIRGGGLWKSCTSCICQMWQFLSRNPVPWVWQQGKSTRKAKFSPELSLCKSGYKFPPLSGKENIPERLFSESRKTTLCNCGTHAQILPGPLTQQSSAACN